MKYLIIEMCPEGRRFENVRELAEINHFLNSRKLRTNHEDYFLISITLIPE